MIRLQKSFSRACHKTYLTSVGYSSVVKLYNIAYDPAIKAFPVKAKTVPIVKTPIKCKRIAVDMEYTGINFIPSVFPNSKIIVLIVKLPPQNRRQNTIEVTRPKYLSIAKHNTYDTISKIPAKT